MNPTKRLYKNRSEIREKNLIKDLGIWEFILNNINSKDTFSVAKNNETLDFKIVNQKLSKQISNYDFNIEDIEKRLISIASQIFKVNSIEYNIDYIKEISLDLVKKKIRLILKSPNPIQLHFCQIPNKQGCDEAMQNKMLNEKINFLNLEASKFKPNTYLHDAKLTNEKPKKTKSIDSFVSNKNINSKEFYLNPQKFEKELIFLGYQKVIMVSGGHQDNQLKDILSFVNNADNYSKENTNSTYFFVQADGDYCNDNMYKIENEINNKKKIFTGTTNEVIKWIKDVKKKF